MEPADGCGPGRGGGTCEACALRQTLFVRGNATAPERRSRRRCQPTLTRPAGSVGRSGADRTVNRAHQHAAAARRDADSHKTTTWRRGHGPGLCWSARFARWTPRAAALVASLRGPEPASPWAAGPPRRIRRASRAARAVDHQPASSPSCTDCATGGVRHRPARAGPQGRWTTTRLLPDGWAAEFGRVRAGRSPRAAAPEPLDEQGACSDLNKRWPRGSFRRVLAERPRARSVRGLSGC
jgi:hypothetical protein